ncbi:MAG: 3-keto-5-aminohexanoate cleavage protein [Bacillota bacterium]|nr:3-keto-5-aminohexanoate cleavage protein [Bacillota bacterium]
MDPIIVNFTPTGMIPTRSDTPKVPLSPQEIIEDVREAVALGITMVHLHARDADSGRPDYRRSLYAEMIGGIRRFAPDLIICVSTSGRAYNTFEKRADVLGLTGDLKPDMASLTLSSLNFNHQASINEPDMIMALAREMQRCGIKPELEIFDLGMVNYTHYLIKKKLLEPPFYANLILGNIACAQSDLLHIGVIIKDLPAQTIFSLGGIGRDQLQTNSLAIAMGYGVRVGLEDNIWYDQDRTRLASNGDLIRRLGVIAQANDKRFMKPAQLRERLGLKPGHGSYGC